MICPTCGTEIAERALICYRCGNAPVAARRQPPRPRTGWGRRLLASLAFVALLLAGAFMGMAEDIRLNVPGSVVLALLVLVLLWRLAARRRPRPPTCV